MLTLFQQGKLEAIARSSIEETPYRGVYAAGLLRRIGVPYLTIGCWIEILDISPRTFIIELFRLRKLVCTYNT
jgi:hypothetical protein